MKAASLIIGINDSNYATRWTEGSSIQFAENDAESLYDFLLNVWSGSAAGCHERLTGASATRPRIDAAVASLSSARYDHVTVFLAGHGVVSDGRAYFCLADGTSNEPGLGARELDTILSNINAEQVLVLIDACHAEDVLFGCSFFTALRAATARIFLCGCRGNQRSWEHEPLRHGIFTWVLLEALNAAGPTTRELSNADQVFSYVSEQVALRAMSLKGQRQEPVRGGVTRGGLILPRPRDGRDARKLSVIQVVIGRLRRIVAASAVLACVGAALLQVVMSHVTTGGNGAIVVRRGLPSIGLPGKVGMIVETEFGYDTLSPVQRDLEALRSNSVRQGQLQLTAAGFKTWARDVLPLLTRRDRAQFQLALDGTLPAWVLDASNGDIEPWQVELAAQSLLFQGQADGHIVAWLEASLPKLDASSDPTTLIDQDILGWDSTQFLYYIRAARALCLATPNVGYEQFWRIYRAVAYRAGHAESEGRDPTTELDAVVDMFRALLAARQDAGLDPIPKPEMERLLAQKNEQDDAGLLAECSLASVPSLLDDPTGAEIVDKLFQYIDGFDLTKQGVPDWAQVTAIRYLSQIAVRFSLGDRLIVADQKLAGPVGFQNGSDPVRDFFQQLSGQRALPAALFDRARDRVLHTTPDSMEADYLRVILALQLPYLDPTTKDVIRAQFTQIIAQGSRPDFATAPVLAALSKSEKLPVELVDKIAAQLDVAWDPRLEIPVTTVAFVVSHNDGAFVRALSEIGRHQLLPDSARVKLRVAAGRRRSLPYYDELVDALYYQEKLDGHVAPTAREIHCRLAACTLDADRRRLEADLAALQLRHMAPVQRRTLVRELQSLRVDEPEPELRLALFRVITQAAPSE